MNLLKNPDMKKELLPHLLLTLLLTVIGLWIALAAGALALISGLLFMVLHLWQAFHRYQAMEELSRKIDRILHGQDEILITRKSGRASLRFCTSEIEKMTIRLREQTDLLRKEKVNLSNAIADISHQLRTPLASLNLTASMLTRENISDADRLRLARDLKKSLQRIDWLIESPLLNPPDRRRNRPVPPGKLFGLQPDHEGILPAADLHGVKGAAADRSGAERKLHRRSGMEQRSAGKYPEELHGAHASRRNHPDHRRRNSDLYGNPDGRQRPRLLSGGSSAPLRACSIKERLLPPRVLRVSVLLSPA